MLTGTDIVRLPEPANRKQTLPKSEASRSEAHRPGGLDEKIDFAPGVQPRDATAPSSVNTKGLLRSTTAVGLLITYRAIRSNNRKAEG